MFIFLSLFLQFLSLFWQSDCLVVVCLRVRFGHFKFCLVSIFLIMFWRWCLCFWWCVYLKMFVALLPPSTLQELCPLHLSLHIWSCNWSEIHETSSIASNWKLASLEKPSLQKALISLSGLMQNELFSEVCAHHKKTGCQCKCMPGALAMQSMKPLFAPTTRGIIALQMCVCDDTCRVVSCHAC